MAKKGKTFLVRRLTRKVKEEKEDSTKSKEKLATAKVLDHSKLGLILLRKALSEIPRMLELAGAEPEGVPTEAVKILETASIRSEQDRICKDAKAFVAKLFHEDDTKDKKAEAVVVEKSENEADDEKRPEQNFFMASLNAGNSDSEDDHPVRTKGKRKNNDYDDDGIPKKKNRLGQRARRAMWEQQYGDKAKHIKRAKDEKKKAGPARKSNPNRPVFEDNSVVKRALPKKTESTESLHPSWAAKKAQKERLASASAEPSRIVFED